MSPPPVHLDLAAVGVLRVEGADRLALLQRLSSGELRPLARPGALAHTLFLTAQGRLVEWAVALAAADCIYLVVAAGRAAALAAWIDRYVVLDDVRCHDVSAAWTHVALTGAGTLAAGPAAGSWVAQDGGLAWSGLAAYGERRELLLPAATAPATVAAHVAAGARRLDAAAREVQRLTAGVPSPAHEYAEQVAPLELRLGAVAIAWNKGCYIGQEVIARLTTYDKVARLLIGVRAAAPLVVDPSRRLLRDGAAIGRLTAAAAGPDGWLALAVVKRAAAVAGPATLDGPDPVPCEVWLPPFCAG